MKETDDEQTEQDGTHFYEGEPVHVRGTWFHVFEDPNTDGIVTVQLPDPDATDPEPIRFISMKDEDGTPKIENHREVDQEDIDEDSFKQAMLDAGINDGLSDQASELLNDFTSKLPDKTVPDMFVTFLGMMASLFIGPYDGPENVGEESDDSDNRFLDDEEEDHMEDIGFEPSRAKKAVKKAQRDRTKRREREPEKDVEYLLLLLRQAQALREQIVEPQEHTHYQMMLRGIDEHIKTKLIEHEEVELNNLSDVIDNNKKVDDEEKPAMHNIMGQAVEEYNPLDRSAATNKRSEQVKDKSEEETQPAS